MGTDYERDGYELQLTFAVAGPGGGVIVPVPEQPIVLYPGPLAHVRRHMNGVSVRVLTLEMMLALKATPRPDEEGGAKDRADLEVLRSLTGDPAQRRAASVQRWLLDLGAQDEPQPDKQWRRQPDQSGDTDLLPLL